MCVVVLMVVVYCCIFNYYCIILCHFVCNNCPVVWHVFVGSWFFVCFLLGVVSGCIFLQCTVQCDHPCWMRYCVIQIHLFKCRNTFLNCLLLSPRLIRFFPFYTGLLKIPSLRTKATGWIFHVWSPTYAEFFETISHSASFFSLKPVLKAHLFKQ